MINTLRSGARDSLLTILLICASVASANAEDGKSTAKPARGTRIGGIVKSDKGQPIEGAKVIINGVVRDEVGQFLTKEIAKTVTDRAGKWSSESAPTDVSGLNFQLSHPDYRPAEYDQADEPGEKTVSKKNLLAGKAVMVLESAIRVEGVVKDAGGELIPAATIVWENSDDPPKKRTLKTDDKGHFAFSVIEPSDASLVVQAKGHAPAFRRVSIERGLEPLKFTLGKGQTLKGRVLDADGKPVQGASVSVASWNDTSLLNWRQLTDAEGRFTWGSAPEGQVMLSITKNGFNPANARGETDEIKVGLQKTFLIIGKVVDAETKEPIKQFTLTRGFSYGGSDDDHVNWERYDQKHGRDGEYSIAFSDHQRGGRIKVMVEADGYLPAATPLLAESGWHTNDFELKKGSGPKGVVKSPDGKPVEDAQVAVLGGSYISLGKAEFKNFNESENFVVKTDVQGRFALPPSLSSSGIVAVHEQGYAETSLDKLEKEPTVTLQPWGRIQGLLKIGKSLGTNELAMVAARQTGIGSLNYDFENFKTETDAEGRFEFDHVPPGDRRLVRLLPIERGWAWSHITPITVKPGETLKTTLGGTGRMIVGKAKLSEPERKIDWLSGHHSLSSKMPKQPKPFKNQAEWMEWQNSPEYKKATENHRSYALRFSPDGSFRIEDVAAGDYSLSIYLNEPGDDDSRQGQHIGSVNKEITVSELPKDGNDDPLDIGVVEIKVKKDMKVGTPAPAFEAKTLDGKPLKLSDYRGKFVLLDFWATWCGPCVAEIPSLKEAYEVFGKDERFAMISLSLDSEAKAPEKFVKEKELKWIQGFLGDWSDTDVPNSYGVQGIPAAFLIDPSGKIIAKNIRGSAIRSAVEKALAEKKADAN